MDELIQYRSTNDIYDDICQIIEEAQRVAVQSVNTALVLRNWLLGKRIATENMDGTRAERYGEKIIAGLSEELTQKYGKGFDKRSLYRYVQFYQQYLH